MAGRLRLLSIVCSTIVPLTTGAASPPEAEGAVEVTFTGAQADAGAEVYGVYCSACHGNDLDSGAAPALAGPQFMKRWSTGGRTVGDLFGTVKGTMPLNHGGSLGDEQYTAVVSFILSRNGHAAGTWPLSPRAFGARLMSGSVQASTKMSSHAAVSLPAVPDRVERAATDRPGDEDLAHPSDADWLTYNGTLSGQRYSKLDQINSQNVRDLRAICLFQPGEVGTFQTSPVIYDGVMYITSAYSTYAIDSRTCVKIWSHAYPSDNTTPLSVSRGVALYRGKVFRVTPNGHLIALDARTGSLLWDVHLSDPDRGYWLSAAPVAHEGKVFIGEAGADWGVNAHIYAFDTETAKLLWTFNVIPTGTEPGADTWQKGAERGGGSSWSSYTLEPATGSLYVSVGNPAPDFDGAMRPGRNLFTDSVVALQEGSGKLQWYVQQVPHDVRDWDTAAAPILYDQDGRHYMAVANKGGWLYIYDRGTRRLLARPEVTTHLNADAPITREGTHYCPGLVGGVEWNGPAHSPRDRLLFVNSVDWCVTTRLTETRFVNGLAYLGGSYTNDPLKETNGWTRAFDAATGQPLWSRPSHTPMLAALTPTAGGILFTGDLDGNFLVLESKSGRTLYQFHTGGAMAGGISTYMIDGRQFVAVTSGNVSRSFWQNIGAPTVSVFSLPGE